MAYNPTRDASNISPGDNAWVLTSGSLVLLMAPGVAFFYGGIAKTKDLVSIHVASVICIAIVTIQWFLFGYTIAFEPSSVFWGSINWAALSEWGIGPVDNAPSISGYSHMIFHGQFAVITSAILAGVTVSRMNYFAFVLFLLLWTTLGEFVTES